MSAIIPANGPIRQVDLAGEPLEQITPEQVTDEQRLARLLMDVLRQQADLSRRFWPQFIDFEDVAVDATGATVYRFAHGLGGRVRWWPVDWSGATAGPRLVRHANTDDNTLCLVSYTAGTLTLRVEVAG